MTVDETRDTLIVDCEVRVVHPDARRPDYLAGTHEAIRRELYSHPAIGEATRLWGIESLIESMNDSGIRYALLSGLAWRDSMVLRENNDYVLSCLERHHDRLRGLYTPDVSSPERAADEIMNLDGRHYVGIELIPKWQGVRVDDANLEPIFESARRRNMFVKVYTAHPTQTLDGDAPYRTLQFLRRHPEIRTLIPHLGGLLCLYGLQPGIRDAIRNAYFITSVSSTMTMVKFAAEVNPDNLLFGTDFPFNHCFDQVTPLEELKRMGLSPDVMRRIAGETATELFDFERGGDSGRTADEV